MPLLKIFHSQSSVLCYLQRLSEEHQAHAELRVRHQKMAMEYADLKSQLKTDDFKVENYNKVK